MSEGFPNVSNNIHNKEFLFIFILNRTVGFVFKIYMIMLIN